MKNNVYVFYNNLSRRYGDVFCAPTDEFAGRQIALMFSNPNCTVRREETEVCRVGTIDVECGVMIASDAPIRIDIPSDVSKVNIDSQCTPSGN